MTVPTVSVSGGAQHETHNMGSPATARLPTPSRDRQAAVHVILFWPLTPGLEQGMFQANYMYYLEVGRMPPPDMQSFTVPFSCDTYIYLLSVRQLQHMSW